MDSTKLGNFVTVSVGDQDADFWIVRRGTPEAVGKPLKVYDPESYGVRVTSPDILPDYLYYVMLYVHSTGYFKSRARGAIALVNIKKTDITDISINL